MPVTFKLPKISVVFIAFLKTRDNFPFNGEDQSSLASSEAEQNGFEKLHFTRKIFFEFL